MLLVASVLICIDITLRYTVRLTLGGADELSGYALAISSAWGFSSALLSRSHIRIDTVYVRIKSIGVRAVLDLVSLGTLRWASSAWSPGTPGASSGSPGCRARARCRRSRRRW